jgi:4-aminobutyrate aminotransferase-like enzyme
VGAELLEAAARIVARCRDLEGDGMRSFLDDEPLVWERAHGATIVDADGREYTDLFGGFAVAAIGHQHPAVVEAVRRQAGELMHVPSAHPSRVRAGFYEALASIAPPGLTRILPAITGAMANEVAISIARVRRPGAPIVAFEGGYFGRSLGTVGFAGKARYREALGVPAAAQFLAYPDPETLGPDAAERVLSELERLAGPAGGLGEPAAVLVEPVQGNGGVVVPPPGFLPGLRAFCDRTSALLIVDEVQSGCGRTGRMWALEHTGVTPDLVTVGKGIGGGLPVAAVLGTAEAMSVLAPDAYSSTFLTNNLTLAAAIAAIGVLRDERLPERASRLAAEVADPRIATLEGRPGVGPVRRIGLWYGIGFCDARGRPDPARARRVRLAARAAGVGVGPGGYEGEVVKVSPPLVIGKEELGRALDRLLEVVETTEEA